MEVVNADRKEFKQDHAASQLLAILQQREQELLLQDAVVYYDFPIYRDEDGDFVTARVLLIAPRHGLKVIAPCNAARAEGEGELASADRQLDNAFSCLYSRLLRNRRLRATKTTISIPHQAFIYAPYLTEDVGGLQLDVAVVTTEPALCDVFSAPLAAPLEDSELAELLSTVEGSKGLLRTKIRDIATTEPNSKGRIVAEAEAAIASFDLRQKNAYVSSPDGVERIRGLAGSGKTVILAMKAALTHLRHPEADIVYTFCTKSLYQHIKRLTTRFYRQYHEQDPNWERLRIMHAWGGSSNPGVYSSACQEHGLEPRKFGDPDLAGAEDKFDAVCQHLMENVKIRPMFDFVFVDEGQDFPGSFIRLCASLAHENRLAWAYDDLQTIFRATTPSAAQVFGTDDRGEPVIPFARDIVLYKCYRNPREILVTAHAVGFGIYGTRIVQMLENAQHWEDLGYKVVSGNFVEGDDIEIERPPENSLELCSRHCLPAEIVTAHVFENIEDEVGHVITSVKGDLEEGMRPDDILVICVDDRHAKDYLRRVAKGLRNAKIMAHDIHTDAFGLIDFYCEGHVTLSTVHKAKGNEAFVIYVIGVDALFSPYAAVRERNMLFTAMTRAKGWVRVSGCGTGAHTCKEEIDTALRNFPYLRFSYPSEAQLKVMRRDLAADAIRKQQAQRLMEQLVEEYGVTPQELGLFLEGRREKSAKQPKDKRRRRPSGDS